MFSGSAFLIPYRKGYQPWEKIMKQGVIFEFVFSYLRVIMLPPLNMEMAVPV
jgi:hypothetical protein